MASQANFIVDISRPYCTSRYHLLTRSHISSPLRQYVSLLVQLKKLVAHLVGVSSLVELSCPFKQQGASTWCIETHKRSVAHCRRTLLRHERWRSCCGSQLVSTSSRRIQALCQGCRALLLVSYSTDAQPLVSAHTRLIEASQARPLLPVQSSSQSAWHESA